MHTLTTRIQPLDHPKLYLVLNFVAWKLVLLCIALTSPGPGYDTSTELLRPFPDLAQANSGTKSEPALRLRSLVRWDAIYYTQVARRGYLWEQEWAFGWGFTNFIAVISKGKRIPPHIHRIKLIAFNSPYIQWPSVAAWSRSIGCYHTSPCLSPPVRADAA